MNGSSSAIRQQGALDEIADSLDSLICRMEESASDFRHHTGRLIGWEPEAPAIDSKTLPEETKTAQLRNLLQRAHHKLSEIQHEVNRLNDL